MQVTGAVEHRRDGDPAGPDEHGGDDRDGKHARHPRHDRLGPAHEPLRAASSFGSTVSMVTGIESGEGFVTASPVTWSDIA